MPVEMKAEIDNVADRYGMPKTHLMRLMLRAGLQDIEHGGLDAVADRADGEQPDVIEA